MTEIIINTLFAIAVVILAIAVASFSLKNIFKK